MLSVEGDIIYAETPSSGSSSSNNEYSEQAIEMVAESLSRSTGQDKRKIIEVLKDLASKDEEIKKILNDYTSFVRSLASSGEASKNVADVINAKLLAKLGDKLTYRLDRAMSMDITDIIELIKLDIIREILADMKGARKSDGVVIRQPLLDENGRPVRGPDGKPIYIEYIVPPGAPIPMPMGSYNPVLKKIKELEEKIEKVASSRGGENSDESNNQANGPVTTFVNRLSEYIATRIGEAIVQRLIESGQIDDLIELIGDQAIHAMGQIIMEEKSKESSGQ